MSTQAYSVGDDNEAMGMASSSGGGGVMILGARGGASGTRSIATGVPRILSSGRSSGVIAMTSAVLELLKK